MDEKKQEQELAEKFAEGELPDEALDGVAGGSVSISELKKGDVIAFPNCRPCGHCGNVYPPRHTPCGCTTFLVVFSAMAPDKPQAQCTNCGFIHDLWGYSSVLRVDFSDWEKAWK